MTRARQRQPFERMPPLCFRMLDTSRLSLVLCAFAFHSRCRAVLRFPSLRAFCPDLIIISAGFDGAHHDAGNIKNVGKPMEGMDLLPEGASQTVWG